MNLRDAAVITAGLCLFGSAGALRSRCLLVTEQNVPVLAVGKCLEHGRQDKALGHRITESQNGRGWKGPLWVI